MKFYAKSDTKETIAEHTQQLLNRLEQYKKLYATSLSQLTERDWELLEWAVIYHDVGKADLFFQNKIRKNINEPLLPINCANNIPHNYLSVLAIPFKELNFSKEEEKLVAQLVAFHHERGELPDKDIAHETYVKNMLCHQDEIEKHMSIKIDAKPRKVKFYKLRERYLPSDKDYERYVLLKGILHRLDHAASAQVPIELATHLNVSEYTNQFFQLKLKCPKNALQTFAEANKNNHVVAVAQTGMGKTEAGLLWLDGSKGFFTLPLRVSINAMYSRITEEENIGFTLKDEEEGEIATGLLHSTSLDYLYDQEEANDSVLEKMHSQSKEFANKLIITTVDQILKFPLLYLGFEKEYATMATAKVIIDELQAYDPKIAAVLIRALTMLDKIGGSFMIMTATLPSIYLDALKEELGESVSRLEYGEFIDDSVKRHHVVLDEKSILDEEVVTEIVEHGQRKKVLVICNTIRRAMEVYDSLKESNASVRLLHSRFIKKDRGRLEKEILTFAKSADNGIWVTTQLVEASLDIDFDMLYTEMSPLDSLFQRFGRCNRKGKKDVSMANVKVLTANVDGIGSVYHRDIFERSLEILRESHSKGLLLESQKLSMIKKLYNREALLGSSYLKEFDATLIELKNKPHYEMDFSKKKAQELLRDIQQVQVIPDQFTADAEFVKKLETWKKATSKIEKRKSRNALEAYSVNVNPYYAKGLVEVEGLKGLYYIDSPYDEDKGLILSEQSYFD